MNIAQVVQISKAKSGLYETTREICCALRALGHDARLIPTEGSQLDAFTFVRFPPGTEQIIESGTPCDPATVETFEDRGAISARDEWLTECDVILAHSGIDERHRMTVPDTPVVQMLHGAPEYCFRMENLGGIRAYSSMHAVQHGPNRDQWAAFVTFWPQHVPYWQVILPPEKLHCVQSCVDLEWWDPAKVKPDYDWGGHKAEINVVCSSSWRAGNVDIFDVVTAYWHFAKAEERSTKLHIYGGAAEMPSDAWRCLVKCLRDDDLLGEMPGWVGVERLRSIYRTADLMVTPHCVASRGVREAMAMGCPVVASRPARHAKRTAQLSMPCDFAHAMSMAYSQNNFCRAMERNAAALAFHPAETARQLIEVIEGVL